MTEPKELKAPEDPLEMVNNLLAGIRAMAERAARDPLATVTERLGERNKVATEAAANLALASIARDLRRIADHLTGGGS